MRKIITLLIIISSIYLCSPKIFADEREKENKDKIELNESQIAFLDKLVQQGLLILKPELNQAYINPNLWAQMNIMQKENISAAIAVYCGNFKGKNTYWAVIYDLQSGKKLAKYSRAWGFKVY